MIPNTDITIYNKYINPTTRAEVWQRTQIQDVVWEDTKAIASQRFQQPANVATVFIPFAVGTQYVYPKAWQLLITKTGYWTLQEGDVIVRGLAADEITGAFTMTSLRAKYDFVLSIASVDRMDQGSDYMQHWEVGCK